MPDKPSISAVPQNLRRLSRTEKTPFLAVDENLLRLKFQQLQQALPDFKIFYALKTNSHIEIIKVFQSLGSNFEISSKGEMDLLLQNGVKPHQIITSNPTKSPGFIKAAHEAGVNDFAFDSEGEISKLSQLAPGSRVYVRLAVSNEASQWPLSGKFGVETGMAASLLIKASKSNLVPYGITFHVGSQCLDELSWGKAIAKSKLVWDMISDKGINLKMLNVGGGIPARHFESVPSIKDISTVITKTLKRNFPEEIDLFIEPGRGFLGESGIMASTVIAIGRRNEDDWLHLDVGVFNGLMESVGGIEYPMVAEKAGPLKKWIVAGPSCDGFDVISKDVRLPELQIGDKVYILSAGAYTTVYASEFNGLPIPKTYIYQGTPSSANPSESPVL